MEEAHTSRTPRGKSFSIFEDQTLCRSWLEVSQNPLCGTKQMQAIFWNRVLENYNVVHGDESNRTTSSLLYRWCSIRNEVNKFCGYLAQVESRHENENIEGEKIVEAKRIYREIHKKHFLFEHCWNILRGNSQWEELTTTRKQSKKTPALNHLAPSVSTDLVPFNSAIAPSSSPSLSPSTPNTPVSLDSDIDLEQLLPGQGPKKLADRKDGKEFPNKRRDFEGVLDTLSLQNQKIIEMLQSMSSHRAKREQKKSEYKSRQLKMLKMINEREQRKEEDEIMSKDTSNMNDMQKAYYDLRRKEILARMNIDCSSC